MMNRIISARAAALAIAAPLLFAAPTLAQPLGSSGQSTAKLTYVHGGHSHRHYGPKYDHYYDQRSLRREAVRACRRAIRQGARQIGFYDIDFDDGRRVKQIAPYGFRVTFNEVEFEGRRRDFERRVSCTVRRGQVVDIDGLYPKRHRHAHHRHYY